MSKTHNTESATVSLNGVELKGQKIVDIVVGQPGRSASQIQADQISDAFVRFKNEFEKDFPGGKIILIGTGSMDEIICQVSNCTSGGVQLGYLQCVIDSILNKNRRIR